MTDSRRHRTVITYAALVVALLTAALLTACALSGDEEAPIRVRNGSLDLLLESSKQVWEQEGSSGNWRVKDKKRPKNLFDVTVTPASGATCTGSLTDTQPVVKFTYSNNAVIMLESPASHTVVLPSQGASLTSPSGNPQLLTYATAGFLKEVAVGPNPGQLRVICSFASAAQLDVVAIGNPK